MSNILRVTPMGMTNTLYGANPTIGSQLAGLGTAAYGASRMGMFAEGGVADATPKGKKKKAAGLAELAMTKI